ncbi:MAG: hypothetical protein U5L75_00600 [Candidatus Campbellbacteria bacterium]|nr:hypothetical protein [Candidatus Campbellbacteria bacterium]
MKIKSTLPQFENKNALLIVTEKETAKLYVASDGEVGEVEAIEIDPKELEGDTRERIQHRSVGGAIVRGRSSEEEEEKEVNHFLNKLEEKLKGVVKKFDISEVYVFSPSYVNNEVVRRIPKKQRESIEENFRGNYSHKHALKLIEMIKQSLEEKFVKPRSEEAQRIYNKFSEE